MTRSNIDKFMVILTFLFIFSLSWNPVNPTRFGTLLQLSIIFVWIARIVKSKKVTFEGSFFLLIWIFVILNITSMIWTQDFNRSYSRSINNLLFSSIVIHSVIDIYKFENDVRSALAAYVVGTYVVAFGVVLSIVADPAAGGHYSAFNYTPAITGTYPPGVMSPNQTGIVLALSTAISWYLFLTIKNNSIFDKFCKINILYIPVSSIFVLLTSSRQSLVVLTICLTYILISAVRLNKINGRSIGYLLIPSSLVLSQVIPNYTIGRISNIYEPIINLEGNFGSRFQIWEMAYKIGMEAPILGHGAATYRTIIGGGSNTYIVVFFELGLIGLIIYILIILSVLYNSLKLDPIDKYFSISIILSWTLIGMLRDNTHSEQMFIMFALIIVIVILNRHKYTIV